MFKKFFNKIKKPLMIVFSIIIMLCSVFTFSASATTYTDLTFSDYFSSAYYNYEISDSAVNTGVAFSDDQISINRLPNWSQGVYHIVIDFYPGLFYQNNYLYTSLKADCNLAGCYFQGNSDLNYFSRTDSSGNVEYADFSYAGWGYGFNFDYPEKLNKYVKYTLSLYVYVQGNYFETFINLDNIYITAYTEEEALANGIIDNQNQNTDKILNGWDNAPPVDSSSVNNHNQIENEINANNQQGITDTKGLFSNFNLSNGNIGRGLLAVTQIFNNLTAVGWLNELLQYGLIIGIFGFILGTTQLIRSFIGGRK